MIDLLLFILATPVVAAACIIWLIVFMRSLAWLAERLDSRLDRPRRVEVHHYHHIALPKQPITVIRPGRPQIAAQRTVAYPIAAKSPQRIERR